MTDAEIRAAIAEDPDAAPEWTEEDFRNAVVVPAPPKKTVSLAIDEEVLAWFRSLGPGWKSQIAMILRAYMERHREAVAAQRAERARAAEAGDG